MSSGYFRLLNPSGIREAKSGFLADDGAAMRVESVARLKIRPNH